MSKQDLERLTHTFISNRVDYCYGLFTGLSEKALWQLQLTQNTAARLLTKSGKYHQF